MNFKQPEGKDNFMAAVRTCTGVQATGRVMPTILPEGLSPKAHLAVALRTKHPFSRPPVVPEYCARAIANQLSDAASLVSLRK